MSIDLSWHTEGRIILAHFHGVVTPDDLVEMGKQYAEMIAGGRRPIHMILHLLDVRSAPSDGKQIAEFEFKPDRMGWLLFVAENTLSRGLVSLFFRMNQSHHVSMVRSLEIALDFLHQHDHTLAMSH